MRRATTPALFVTLRLPNGSPQRVECASGEEISKPITLQALIGNRSPQPSFHSVVLIGLDADLPLRTTGDFGQTSAPANQPDPPKNWVTRKLSSPPLQLIFQEADPVSISLAFSIYSKHLSSTLFRLTTIVQTPGFTASENWVMICQGSEGWCPSARA